MLNAADWFRFGLGAGYRLVESAGELDERLRGFTASVGIQLGSSWWSVLHECGERAE